MEEEEGTGESRKERGIAHLQLPCDQLSPTINLHCTHPLVDDTSRSHELNRTHCMFAELMKERRYQRHCLSIVK